MNLRTNKKEKKEYVLFVLDKSGSMNGIRKETLSGLNEQIQELKKTAKEIETKVSMVTFDSEVEFLRWNQPLEEFEELKDEEYQPNGMTAMLDAVGMSMDRLRNEVDTSTNDVSFLVIIVSDGYENSSREYDWTKVAEIVKKAKDDNRWTVTYMGANQDLSIVTTQMGLDTGNTVTWTTTNTGTNMAYLTMGEALGSYRRARITCGAADLDKMNFYTNSTDASLSVDNPPSSNATST